MDALAAALGPACRRDVPIGPRTTYRVGGRAALWWEASRIEDLLVLAANLAPAGVSVPVLVLGRGSNLLVADGGFPGLVVTLSSEDAFGAITILPAEVGAGGAGIRVRAGGAVALPVLARQTAAAGLTGLEWAVGVPGSVGGAVRMNAGGHGADTRGVLDRCRIVDLATGTVATWFPDDLAFGYRCSAVAARQVVVDADYRVAAGERAEAEATIREILRWRREHQPGGQNAGSVFVNPLGDPPANSAGWLVDAAGLKGLRHGSAMVSTKHANFIQADSGGSADDVFALMVEVHQRVKERLGVVLRAETCLVGFPEDSLSSLELGCAEE
jgi:UDP-N-acetylmuramate dehydrogenase